MDPSETGIRCINDLGTTALPSVGQSVSRDGRIGFAPWVLAAGVLPFAKLVCKIAENACDWLALVVPQLCAAVPVICFSLCVAGNALTFLFEFNSAARVAVLIRFSTNLGQLSSIGSLDRLLQVLQTKFLLSSASQDVCQANQSVNVPTVELE